MFSNSTRSDLKLQRISRQELAFTVLITTVMSVMATVLAGLSSSEMTRAQLNRALAAQAQSRAGDQWAFFQAKRVRGTQSELTVDLLGVLAPRNSIDAAELQDASTRLADSVARLHADAGSLKEAVVKAASTGRLLGGTQLAEAAAGLVRGTEQPAKQAPAMRDQLAAALAGEEVQRSFVYLAGDAMPESPKQPLDPRVVVLLEQLGERRPDSEITPNVRALSLQEIQAAIDVAEANRVGFEKVGKPVNTLLANLDGVIENQLRSVRPVWRAVRGVRTALADLSGKGRDVAEIQAAGAAVLDSAAALRGAAEDLNGDFKAARLDYNARRYRLEAEHNRELSGLYDLEVRKYGIESDRLRERSKHFFYGMLGAQAAVTIASLSLAVRQRSLFWALAAAAGLGTLLFGGYVYLFL
jgi:hypothetical protein